MKKIEMSPIELLISKAVKTATNPHNFSVIHTVSAIKNLNVSQDGPTVVKHNIIVVPVDVFHFHSFESYKRRVVLDRATLTIKQILKK